MNQNIIEVKVEHGTYYFKLEEVLKKKGLSKNQLVKDTNTDFKVIKRLASGNIVRIDIYVLARLCDYLHCEPSDIIEYKKEN